MEDITKKGVDGLTGLNTVEGTERELNQMGKNVPQEDQRSQYYSDLKSINAAPFTSIVAQKRYDDYYGEKAPVVQGVGQEGVGDSYYDKYIGSLTDLDNLEAVRGENQSAALQIFNGVAKAGVLAATTFIDGTVGTIFGLGNWIATGEFQGLWNNPISQALQDVNDWSERALPNYQSMEQQEANWWNPSYIFSANFLGDNILKNLGFTIGAAYSGKVWNAGLMKGLKAASKLPGLSKLDLTTVRNAYKGASIAKDKGKDLASKALLRGQTPLEAKNIVSELALDAKKLKTAGVLQQWNGAFFGALGEGRSEAIRGVREFNEDKLFHIEDNHQKAMNQAALDLAENDDSILVETLNEYGEVEVIINPEREEAVRNYAKKYYDVDAEKEALKHINSSMGNMIYMANIGVLTLSDAYAFGSFFAGGYKTGRKIRGIRSLNRGAVKEFTTKLSVPRTIRKLSGKAFSEGVYEEMGQNLVTEVATSLAEQDLEKFYEGKYDPEGTRSLNEYLNALMEGIQNSYLDAEAWEEGFSGAISGMMGIPKFRSMRRNGKFRSPVTVEGGIFEDIRDIKEDRKNAKEMTQRLNDIVQGEDFLNYYQGLIRSSNFQKKMDAALEAGDEFNFKNHELSKLISDVNTFAKAGRIQDFYDIIEGMSNINESQIPELKEFVDNKEDGTNVFQGKSDSEIIDHIKKQAQYIKEGADSYMSVLEDLNVKYGDIYSDETIEEMAFYTVHADNLQKRYDTLAEEVKTSLKEEYQGVDLSDKVFKVKRTEKGKPFKHHLLKDSDSFTAEEMLNSSPGDLIEYSLLSSEALDFILGPEGDTKATPTEVQDRIDKYADLFQIAGVRSKYINLLNRAIEDPSVIQKETEEKKKEAKEATDNMDVTEVKETIKNLKSEAELIDYINTYKENNPEYTDLLNAIDELAEEGNAVAGMYKNKQSYNNNLKSHLRRTTDSETYSHASYLWDSHLQASEDLNDLTNPNSDILNDRTVLNDPKLSLEENEYNFLKAQYAIHNSMKALNNSKKFSDLIKDEYKEFTNPNKSTLDKEAKKRATEAGKDEVGTVPAVNTNKTNKPIFHPEIISENVLYKLLEDANKKDSNKEFIDYLESKGVVIKDSIKKDDKAISNLRDTIESSIPLEDKLDSIFGNNLKTENKDNSKVLDPDLGKSSPDIDSSILEDNKNLKTEVPQESSFFNTRDNVRAAIPEFEIEEVKKGNFIPYNQAKKKQGFNYDTLYDYLKEKGAFDYVDKGNLKEGDQIGFLIDPYLEAQMDAAFPPVILIYKVKDGQILGSLHSGKIAEKYTGLKGLRESIESDYNKFKKENPYHFYRSELTTSVAQILNGVVHYTEEMNNLKGMEEVEGNENNIVFGIIKNGKLVTGKKQVNYTGMKSTKNREGRLYMLIKNAKGEYQPVAIRRKRFNKSEFNNESNEVASSELYGKIYSAAKKLALAKTNADVLHILNNELSHLLYTQNLKLDLVPGKQGGYSLSMRHLQLDENGNEVREKRENEDGTYSDSPVYSSREYIPYFEKTAEGFIERNADNIAAEIIDKLYDLNLPFQIDLNSINQGNYNSRLINSGILSTNIAKAKVNNSFFIADYFNSDLEIQKASKLKNNYKENRRKSTTAVNGKENIIPGTKMVINNQTVYVDTSRDRVYDFNGNQITKDEKFYLDIATAQELYGDVENSENVYNRKARLKNGKIIDLDNNRQIIGKEATKVRKALEKRKKESNLGSPKNKGSKTINARKVKADHIIDQINSDQQKVQKDKTDSKNYYIIEDDGKAYPYSRMHSVLGSNWITSKEDQKKIDSIEKFVDENLVEENIPLIIDEARKFGIDIDLIVPFLLQKNKEKVMSIFRDAILKVNSFRALEAGTAVDGIIRDFFMEKSDIQKPSNISQEAFNSLMDRLNGIKELLDSKGIKFLTNNLVLFHKDSKGNRVAGEVDILAVDKEGNFHIFDVKTSGRSFYSADSFFNKKGNNSLMSSKDYYTLQLSGYKNLFESMYNTPIVNLGIIPFVLDYDGNNVRGITSENYIPLNYNPSVKVANEGGIVQETIYNEVLKSQPIFADITISNNIKDFSSEPKLDTRDQIGVVPYFHKDNNGKQVKTYVKIPLHEVYNVNGNPIYAAKIPTYNSDDFNSGEGIVVKMFDLILVTSNGENITKNPFRVKSNINAKTVEAIAASTLAKIDNNSLEKVFLRENEFTKALLEKQKLEESRAKKEEVIKKDSNTEEEAFEDLNSLDSEDVEGDSSFDISFDSPGNDAGTKITNPKVDNITSAAKSVKTVHKKQSRFKRGRERLSRVTDPSKSNTIRIQEELAWLNKVLPFMSKEGLIEIHKGLINATSQDVEAWGMFKDGMITLSNMATKGTLYHEAFHAVFNSLLTKGEIELLYAEAKEKWGDLSPIQLEENMAEEFKEYTLTRSEEGIGRKLIRFFKSLFQKLQFWKHLGPNLDSLYKKINDGGFANTTLETYTIGLETNVKDNLRPYKLQDRLDYIKSLPRVESKASVEGMSNLEKDLQKLKENPIFKELSSETQDGILNFGITEEQFNRMSLLEKETAVKCL